MAQQSSWRSYDNHKEAGRGLPITHSEFRSRSSSTCLTLQRAAWLFPNCAHRLSTPSTAVPFSSGTIAEFLLRPYSEGLPRPRAVMRTHHIHAVRSEE